MMKKQTRTRPSKTKRKAAAANKTASGARSARKKATAVGIQKRYLLSKPVCKVKFRLPKAAAPEADQVHIVGDFNGWDPRSHPLKRLKTGDHTITIDLATGKEYRYRYLIDGVQWENDWQADRYEPSPYLDSDNSVVTV
jgi:1,4-alpha-glucan branching enzyme